MKEKLVVKIGGSLLFKENLEFDTDFLEKAVVWFEDAKKHYDRIFIIVGGGKMSRYLVDQARPFLSTEENLHRIGMAVTNTNAEVLRTIFNYNEILVPKTLGEALEMVVDEKPKYLVTGGFKEGWSTDMDAAVLAHIIGARKVYKLSNIDHIYTADPIKDPDARIIKDITWAEYFKMFNLSKGLVHHEPGMHVPIGAFCSQFSSEKGLSFMVSGGVNITKTDKLSDVLQSGTLVHP